MEVGFLKKRLLLGVGLGFVFAKVCIIIADKVIEVVDTRLSDLEDEFLDSLDLETQRQHINALYNLVTKYDGLVRILKNLERR